MMEVDETAPVSLPSSTTTSSSSSSSSSGKASDDTNFSNGDGHSISNSTEQHEQAASAMASASASTNGLTSEATKVNGYHTNEVNHDDDEKDGNPLDAMETDSPQHEPNEQQQEKKKNQSSYEQKVGEGEGDREGEGEGEGEEEAEEEESSGHQNDNVKKMIGESSVKSQDDSNVIANSSNKDSSNSNNSSSSSSSSRSSSSNAQAQGMSASGSNSISNINNSNSNGNSNIVEESVPMEEDAVDEEEDVAGEMRRKETIEMMAKIEKDFAELKERLYKEKAQQLERELTLLHKGCHADFIKQVNLLEKRCTDRSIAADLLRQYQIENIERQYLFEVEEARNEYESKKQELSEEFVAAIEERQRKLEEEKSGMDLTGDINDARNMNTRKLRRREKEAATAAQNEKKRRVQQTATGPAIFYQLKDAEMQDDISTIRRILRGGGGSGAGLGNGANGMAMASVSHQRLQHLTQPPQPPPQPAQSNGVNLGRRKPENQRRG